MSDHPGLDFSVVFDSALEEYEKETGKRLAEHPLAKRLDHCGDSLESVSTVLQEQGGAFNEFINSRITKSLKFIIPILHTLSTNLAIRNAVKAVRRRLGWPFYFSHTCSIAFPSRDTNIYRPRYPP
jgi:hypothetical protein